MAETIHSIIKEPQNVAGIGIIATYLTAAKHL